jgi:hypothetical protein
MRPKNSGMDEIDRLEVLRGPPVATVPIFV